MTQLGRKGLTWIALHDFYWLAEDGTFSAHFDYFAKPKSGPNGMAATAIGSRDQGRGM